jgi:hypothetical protein
MAMVPPLPSPYHVLLSHFAHFFPEAEGKCYSKNIGTYVLFEVLTMAVVKNTIFWDITSCSPLKGN